MLESDSTNLFTSGQISKLSVSSSCTDWMAMNSVSTSEMPLPKSVQACDPLIR